jgi:hypothetical protein
MLLHKIVKQWYLAAVFPIRLLQFYQQWSGYQNRKDGSNLSIAGFIYILLKAANPLFSLHFTSACGNWLPTGKR